MTLSQSIFIVEPYAANEKQLARHAHSVYCDFLIAIENKQSPTAIINTYKSLLQEINVTWKDTVRKHLKSGRTVKTILLQSLPSYSLSQFAQEKLNFIFHHKSGNFERMRFDTHNFIEMCKMEVAMLTAKYDKIYIFEIEIALISLMLTYFNVYSENAYTLQTQWDVKSTEVSSAINYVLNQMDVTELKAYGELIDKSLALFNSYPQNKSSKTIKTKPTCADDLQQCFIAGMT